MSASQAAAPPNHLVHETSPYLLQHARNPVDWWPWGDAAFTEARKRDVPIFLSIGYSTCYWCHVMERESFENEAIASQMNASFVCIKVDREERPDVDDLYMAAVQAFSGHGGWPMSVFLEPSSLKPFWAGTYFPAEPKFANMPTFPSVLKGMTEAWRDNRDDVLGQAEELAEAVRERVSTESHPVKLTDEQVTRPVAALLRMFDRNHGGFGATAPKFPQPVFIELLLDARRVSGDEATTQSIDAAVRTTLDKMACGGMFDQIGGGFHRYSVDATWTVPHFEKMLYDNAQLAEVYAKAAVIYTDSFYRRVAIRTFDYVLRELTDAATGAFFSAQDAEVNHREGQNYLWDIEQFAAALDKDDAAWAAKVYGLARGPNFRDPHHPADPPSNVLRLDDRPDRLAQAIGLTEANFLARLDAINARLLAARARRDQPILDDKTLAGWNGLMIGAFAVGGALLAEPRYVSAAIRAADFVLDQLREPVSTPSTRPRGLLRAYRAGVAKVPAFLDDYAFVIRALIEIHRTGTDPTGRYLGAACELTSVAIALFSADDGGFFDTLADQSDLFIRTRTVYDGAVPGGVGVMLLNLLDLSAVIGEPAHRDRATSAVVALSSAIAAAPLGAVNCARALMRLIGSDRDGLNAAFAAANAKALDGRITSPAPAPVEILAPTDRLEIPKDKPGGLVLRIRIGADYHLTAADPGTTERTVGLVPFRVQIINGTGVVAFADYPKGQPFGDNGELLVYRGEFDLPILIERSGTWSGTPLLAVTFQPCTDDACLAARTVELDVAIDLK